MNTTSIIRRVLCAAVLAFTLVRTAHAQWQTQTMLLKPGWNAVYLHVDASHVLLDNLVVGAANPIAEIWLWQPPLSTVQFVTSPAQPSAANSQWLVWDRSPSFTDTLVRLVGNGAYLIHNTNSVDYLWSVTGRPVAPQYQWTTTGLNFIGFPTPANAAPDFDTFLNQVPDLKAQYQGNSASAGIYRYPGGELGANNPMRIIYQLFRSTQVKRGEAFWINAGTSVYNRYFGPFEVVLQDPSGVNFGDSFGTYRVRLRNTSATNRTVSVSLNLLASDPAPVGQTPIASLPPVLLRGAFNSTNFTYASVNLTGAQIFNLTSTGSDGSDIEVVLGLNRTAMSGPVGTLYAGILRFTDSGGLEQVDIPVSATVGDTSGLWVGQASVTSVNQYLKTYANTSDPTTVPVTDAAGFEADLLPGLVWTMQTNQPAPRNWRGVACSADGNKMVAVVNGGQIYISADSGVTWTAQASTVAWNAVASSSDGTKLSAAPAGNFIFTSVDSGVTWVSRSASGSRTWTDIASSADGLKLVAVPSGANIFTSTNAGTNWTARASSRPWSAVASSADGAKLIAAATATNLYTSVDSGTNWTAQVAAGTNAWTGLASSADGSKLFAIAPGTNIFTSVDSGTNWTAQPGSPIATWSAIAASADGSKITATITNGLIYTSTDGGTNWTARESSRAWSSVAMSATGTKQVAVVNAGQVYTTTGAFTAIEIDPNTGRVTARSATNAPYVAVSTNVAPGAVARSFPLRLILHNSAAGNSVNLLERVYIGQRYVTNTVVATRESLLDTATLATARRISAAHLPFSHANTFWPKTSGFLGLGSSLVFNVNLDYNDQVSNPFLHTYHPDHDNLKSDFQTVEVQGAESYTVTRQISLAFTNPAADFASITAGTSTLGGVYGEVITFAGRAGNSRQFTIGGSFTLNRISSIATLTTQ